MTANSAPAYQAGGPKLYRVADGVLALMNFGAGGNVVGPMMGMNLAHALADERPQDMVLPLETPVAVQSPVRTGRRFEPCQNPPTTLSRQKSTMHYAMFRLYGNDSNNRFLHMPWRPFPLVSDKLTCCRCLAITLY